MAHHLVIRMERTPRRRTSRETRFELNACLSVFKHSDVAFSNANQRQRIGLLGAVRREVAFSYNQQLTNIFNSSTTSGIPPVRELFCECIGCYRYTDHPTKARRSLSARLPHPRVRAPRQDNLIPEQGSSVENTGESIIQQKIPVRDFK